MVETVEKWKVRHASVLILDSGDKVSLPSKMDNALSNALDLAYAAGMSFIYWLVPLTSIE